MFCAKTRGVKDILKSLGSRLVSGKYHEDKVFAVMEMASDPPCFWRHFFFPSTSSSNSFNSVDHTKRYLNPTGTHYLRVWHRIFNSPRSVDWNMVLLIAELIFSIPISNAKVERLFSLMKRVKTDSRASLGKNTLANLVRINMEGPSLQEYDPAAAMQLWASGRSRRPQQTKRKKYKKRKCVKKPKVLVNEDTTSEEEEEGVEQNDDEEAMEEDT